VHRALASSGRTVELYNRADVESGALFTRLHHTQAELVLVDRVCRLTAAGPDCVVDEIEQLVRVAAAAASKLVLVTSRARSDMALAALRRSGVPYIILRVERVLEPEQGMADQLAATPRVIVPTEVLADTEKAVLLADVARNVLAALDDESAGRTVDVESVPGDCAHVLLSLLRELGASPAVGGPRGWLWKLFDRPQVRATSSGHIGVDRSHVRRRRLRFTRQPVAEAKPATPQT
jgi:hypothetical protein